MDNALGPTSHGTRLVDGCMMAFEKSLSSRGFLVQSDDSNFPLVVKLFQNRRLSVSMLGVEYSTVPL